MPQDDPTIDDPFLDPKFGRHPIFSVWNTDQRNLIPAHWRREGMLVYTAEDRNYWQLLARADTGTDADWMAFCPCTQGAAYLDPAFTAFALQGQATPLEVGDTVAGGSRAWIWSTVNPVNVKANSIAIADTTGSAVLGSGPANTGSAVLRMSAVTATAPAAHIYTISGVNTQNVGFSLPFEIDFLWRLHWGTNPDPELTANAIKALGDGANLQAGFAGTYSFADPGTAEYYYFCWSDDLGSPTSFADANTGTPVLLATVADDPAYSLVSEGIWYQLTIVINTFGVSTPMRVVRSAHPYSGSYTWAVS
jgi:hypothetical protein